jgi:hypothetical protein
MTMFSTQFDGPLTGLLHWSQWDALRSAIKVRNDGRWFVYFVGEPAPTEPLASDDLSQFLARVTDLLRRDHGERYLGIVYADDLDAPSFVKIYDPNNLGATCGCSGSRVLPGWILSRSRPETLAPSPSLPAGRRRWWRSLFSRRHEHAA